MLYCTNNSDEKVFIYNYDYFEDPNSPSGVSRQYCVPDGSSTKFLTSSHAIIPHYITEDKIPIYYGSSIVIDDKIYYTQMKHIPATDKKLIELKNTYGDFDIKMFDDSQNHKDYCTFTHDSLPSTHTYIIPDYKYYIVHDKDNNHYIKYSCENKSLSSSIMNIENRTFLNDLVLISQDDGTYKFNSNNANENLIDGPITIVTNSSIDELYKGKYYTYNIYKYDDKENKYIQYHLEDPKRDKSIGALYEFTDGKYAGECYIDTENNTHIRKDGKIVNGTKTNIDIMILIIIIGIICCIFIIILFGFITEYWWTTIIISIILTGIICYFVILYYNNVECNETDYNKVNNLNDKEEIENIFYI